VAINAALAAGLGILSAAVDEPGTSVTDSLNRLAADATAAIPSYLGLSVTIDGHDPSLRFTTLADDILAGDVRTSLALALSGTDVLPAVVLVLYAGSPGTLVDLAADLAWLTARPASDFVLDQHLPGPAGTRSETNLLEVSVVNQAIGALIGQGYTLRQADRVLDAHATDAGISRRAAGLRLLAELMPPGPTTGCNVTEVGNPASPE
jgi:hypothetical protein